MNSDLLFERYLDGSMQPHDIEAFEKLIAENPEIREAFDNYTKMDRFLREQHAKMIFTGISDSIPPGNDVIEKDMKEYLAALNDKNEQERELRKMLSRIMNSEKVIFSPAPFRVNKFLKIAALLLVFVGIGSVAWLTYKPASPAAMFNKYYSPYPCIISTRGEKTMFSDTLKLALDAYKGHNYKRASDLFNLVNDLQTEQLKSLYLGICCLEENNETQALASFSNILKYPESRFYIQALWYSGMTCLKFNDSERAKVYFQQIPPELFDYSTKASVILKKL